jgi:hypothetical protein
MMQAGSMMPHTVTLSRSEGSIALATEMLSCPQGDSAITDTNAWINSFNATIIVAIRW